MKLILNDGHGVTKKLKRTFLVEWSHCHNYTDDCVRVGEIYCYYFPSMINSKCKPYYTLRSVKSENTVIPWP